jgi:hypothetical protein
MHSRFCSKYQDCDWGFDPALPSVILSNCAVEMELTKYLAIVAFAAYIAVFQGFEVPARQPRLL